MPLFWQLSKADFIKVMTLHGADLTGQGKSGGELFDANVKLMMLAYRRQRLLDDVKDPFKRRNFMDEAAFAKAYGGNTKSSRAPSPRGLHGSTAVPRSPAEPPPGARSPRSARLVPLATSMASPRSPRSGASLPPHPMPPPRQLLPLPHTAPAYDVAAAMEDANAAQNTAGGAATAHAAVTVRTSAMEGAAAATMGTPRAAGAIAGSGSQLTPAAAALQAKEQMPALVELEIAATPVTAAVPTWTEADITDSGPAQPS